MEQRVQGTLQVWAEPFVPLRVPKLFNLRTDPFERADITSNTYYDWLMHNVYLTLAASSVVTEFLEDVQGIPAAPEGSELHDRPGNGEAGDCNERSGALRQAASAQSQNANPVEAAASLDRVFGVTHERPAR